MRRVFPRSFQATLVRGNDDFTGECVSELGIFGGFLTDAEGRVVANEYMGHNMRTKSIDTDEGGVAAGYSCVDNPYLFEGTDEEFKAGTIAKFA